MLCLVSQTSFAQINADSAFKSVENMIDYLWNRDHDSTYITSFRDKLNVRLLAANKYTFFLLRDKVNNSSLAYRPETGLNLGFGITYNWFSVDLAFNVGIREDKIPNSNFFDFQGAVFTSKFLVEGSLKYYYGYEISDASDIETELNETIRSDIRTINFGLSFLYALRYDKFSMKAPFVFNEIQRRSAGSPVFGVSFNSYTLDADSSVVNPSQSAYFDDPLRSLEGVNLLSINLNIGYMHSFVIKEKFFLTLGLIPGLSFTGGDYATENRVQRNLHLSGMTKTVFALGYNSSRWYGGFQLMADFDLHRLEPKMHLISGHGKSKFYIGYRIKRQ
jgi:hypothetical protein